MSGLFGGGVPKPPKTAIMPTPASQVVNQTVDQYYAEQAKAFNSASTILTSPQGTGQPTVRKTTLGG